MPEQTKYEKEKEKEDERPGREEEGVGRKARRRMLRDEVI